MTYRGELRGKTIELEKPLPYENAQVVRVTVEVEPEDLPPGSPGRVLWAISQPPHLTKEDVDELERAIAEGSRPADYSGIFDEEIDS